MPWQVQVRQDMPVIETWYSGVLSPAELNAAASETLDQARAHSRGLLLADCTTLAGGHSVFDLFDLAEAVRASDMGFVVREAVILPKLPAQAEVAEFWETTSRNKGLQVRLFADRKSAIGWLLQQAEQRTKPQETKATDRPTP